MIEEKKIAIVVPAYNEEAHISNLLETMPKFVDKIYVINDSSTDNTAQIVQDFLLKDERVVLISLDKNIGVGGAIAQGYKLVIKNNEDVAVVMAGDGQMDPSDLTNILRPIIKERCDYSKGNRFIYSRIELSKIPKNRLFGNLILSSLTKIASGYWHVSDTQSGYTAINRRALLAIDWDKCYPRYGYPNDYLIRLNIANMRVCDVPVKSIYGENWGSKMKVSKVIFPILKLLFRMFFMRIVIKYAVREGNPIILYYVCSFLSLLFALSIFIYILIKFFLTGIISQTASIFFVLMFIVFIQLILNSFEMDYRYNEKLYIQPKE